MRAFLLAGASFFGFGCTAVIPEQMLADVNQSIPGQWAVTQQARSGVDVD